ncbi:Carbohydrate-binding WSC subgroup [Penicillium chermesinum]|uniref:Carbohydrate-binding WSC subgroup n=1 Tax=Penicillium chermesinum TaxID=63820 RepID=A0A9W9TI17_9EURO|nr:Carbohydrate-binding WSC subgroup [Penicillium chermesinum]KAJ5223622.1 Carbohydrate-binding WSC subgroup [Penicillium chermesinum]
MRVSLCVSLLAGVIALVNQPLVSAVQLYCASSNTGASYDAVSNIYQSNGACMKTCGNYAFGILQERNVDVSKCNSACAGYPSDLCGNTVENLFGYVDAGNSPTSTAGGSSTTSSETTKSSSVTTSSSSSTTVSSESSPSTRPLTNLPLQSESTSTTSQVALTTSSDGEVKTITVADPGPTSGSDGKSLSATQDDKGSSLSGGSIAGIVIGVIAGLALIGALVFLVFFYRKRARSASPSPSQDMGQRESRASSFFGGGGFPGGSLQRNPTFTDNRLRTDQVLYPNGPRDSSVSLQDDQDYSRPVLRVSHHQPRLISMYANQAEKLANPDE